MKRYLNGIDFFKSHLAPKKEEPLSWNNFNTQNQNKLIENVDSLQGMAIDGEVLQDEKEIILIIKSEIEELKKNYASSKADRLDMDLALIFHKNFKKLKWGRYKIDDFGTWRWISINFFLKEAFWRWSEDDFNKDKFFESSKSCYQRLVGERNRRIFPLWYFTIGERLYDNHFGYSLLEKLADKSREKFVGGFGNLNNNLTDTKLLSPNEHVSKIMSRILLLGEKVASNDEVADAFKRYNGFKRRLLNYGSDNLFENEICIFEPKKAS